MLLVVGKEECLSVAARAAVVHVEHAVAMVHQILRGSTVGHSRLPAGSAVDLHYRRHFALPVGAMRLIKNGRNLQTIE